MPGTRGSLPKTPSSPLLLLSLPLVYMNSYAVRVTLPFYDCSGIVQRWFDRSTSAVCYEHEQDDDVSSTHIHLALIGVDCKIEALKRMWSDAPGKGNEFWSFSDLKDRDKYLTYMTKGKLTAKLAKNISLQQLENSRLAWVDPVKDDKKSGDSVEYYVNKVIKKFEKTTYDMVYTSGDNCSLLQDVRSETMKVFWGENRRVPHATLYKTVAGTAFLRIMERLDAFEEGITHLRELWY